MAKGTQSPFVRFLSGMVLFTILSSLLWLIIKLSDEYTETEPFAILYTDVPPEMTIPNENHSIDATVTTTGFKLLRYYIKPKRNRIVEISLNEINYKKSSFETYSYSSRYLEEKIAEFIDSKSTDVQLNDETQYFVMSKLVSKRVKIKPQTNIEFERQYSYYGEPVAFPDSATIYGTINEIEKINTIQTELISRKKVNQTIETTAKIELSEGISCDLNEVNVLVNVEKYTEAAIEIPITLPDGVNLHLYPNKVKIRYKVAMKDYAIINNLSFKATIDPEDIYINETLPVKMAQSPNSIQIIKIDPEEIEYIVVQ